MRGVRSGPHVGPGRGTGQAMTFDIDWGFIGTLEGAGVTTGYVPEDASGRVLGQPGVTIATGFDLGQHSEADLARLFGRGSAIFDLLLPYAGLRRGDAVAALRAAPLTASASQAAAIDRAVKAEKAARVARAYDAAVTVCRDRALVPFRQLPREAQTVIASVAFQYGDLARRAPTFWGHVVSQDWQAAHDELMDFGDRCDTRRRREAAHLRPLALRRARVR